MAQYISKAAAIAEIKKLKTKWDNPFCATACDAIEESIDTLEVKEEIEVDLEKEIDDYFNKWQNVLCDEDCCNEGGFCCVLDENLKPVDIGRCRKVAKHFFELRLKAREE